MFAAALQFPGYFGKNWDAFRDCITDPEQSSMPAELVILGMNDFTSRFPFDAESLRSCLAEIGSNPYGFEDPRPGAVYTRVVYRDDMQ